MKWFILAFGGQVDIVKVTIRQVAEQAGVSPATVSRVLNRPELVEVETRNRVRAAMERLDFHPNAVARGLSFQKTDTIGLIVPGITDFFFNELYTGIDRAANENGMKVILYDAKHSQQQAFDGFSFLRQHQVDGIIYTSKLVTADYESVLERLGIPVVLVLTQSESRLPLAAYKVDDVRAVFDAVSYLVSRGHRDIGMIAGSLEDQVAGALRLQGYRNAQKFFQLPMDDSQVEYGNFRFEDGYSAMQRLLQKRPRLGFTAICTASDEMAIGAIRCMHDHGLKVPEDISIVGFDDLRIAQMGTPRLTTVAQPFGEIGALAVRRLVDIIRGKHPELHDGVYYLPHRLVERESVRTIL